MQQENGCGRILEGEAEEIIADGALSADHFTWHPISRAVGNVKNQEPELTEAIKSL